MRQEVRAGVYPRVQINWQQFKSFWTAEEVPRWIGMSLVGVFLIGATAIGYRAVIDTRDAFADVIRRSNERSVDLLVAMLAPVAASDQRGQQQLLLFYSRTHDCEQLRVVDGERKVIASIHSDEIGATNVFNPGVGTLLPDRRELHPLPSGGGTIGRWLFRAPIGRSSFARSDGAEPAAPTTVRFVEGVMLAESRPSLGGIPLGTLVTILGVGGMFFTVYRILRRPFRCMS
ncbi:MAG: hypothetical protein IID39_09520, partial [Planctomycetes bacterium]|nr:hypothetical protein [Planctomycetota bacterium]